MSELQGESLIKEFEEQAQELKKGLEGQLNMIRSDRANLNVLSPLILKYPTYEVKLISVASVKLENANTILVSPYNKKDALDIEKVLLKSNIGITPIFDGNSFRLVYPPLTTERRAQYVKEAKTIGEDFKNKLRLKRREFIKSIENLKLTEDFEDDFKDQLQKITDKSIESIDKTVDLKAKDIMGK
jgi:ribosome recycling factor